MGSRGKYAGSPLTFKCAKLAAIWPRTSVDHDAHKVELTGKTKPYRTSKPGLRSTKTSRQYRCSCGHVGWSNHADLARLARADDAARHK